MGRSLVESEGLSHLRQQVLVEELCHLGALGMHDAIETEIEIGLVELEQLLQQGLEAFEFLAHAISLGIGFEGVAVSGEQIHQLGMYE